MCRSTCCDRPRPRAQLAAQACDENVPIPERELDKPFLMPVEDVFSIPGRGEYMSPPPPPSLQPTFPPCGARHAVFQSQHLVSL
jgi:hypothetical protein